MTKRIMLSVVLVAVTSVTALAQRPTWNLNEGDQFYIEEVTNMEIRMTSDGYTESDAMASEVLSRATVLEKRHDGSVVIELRVESSKVGNGGVMQHDPTFDGVAFRITFDASMNVTDFEGYDDLLRRLSGGDALMMLQMRQFMSEDEVKRSLSEPFNIYVPRDNQKSGKTWSRDRHVKLGPMGSASMVVQFEAAGDVAGNSGPVQLVKFTAEGTHHLPAASSGAPLQISGGGLQIKGITGQVRFDQSRGRLDSLEIHAPLRGTLQVGNGFFSSQIDAAINLNQTIRVLDRRPGGFAFRYSS